jgi:hypothetical protein
MKTFIFVLIFCGALLLSCANFAFSSSLRDCPKEAEAAADRRALSNWRSCGASSAVVCSCKLFDPV